MKNEIQRRRLDDFPGGWLVGAFQPSIISSDEIEVGLKNFSRGAVEAEHYQSVATEVTVVISGSCRIGAGEYVAGDIIVIPPHISASFEALEETLLLVVKSPSLPGDKTVGPGVVSHG